MKPVNPTLPLEKIIIVPSKSRYDLCLERFKNDEAARRRFRSKKKWDEVVESDLRQKENIGLIGEELPQVLMVDRSELTDEIISKHSLFVFLGGDNHFTYGGQVILQYIKENPGTKKYVIGVVLDSARSSGGLLYFDVNSFLGNIDRFRKGDYKVEHWTTLEAEVDNGIKKLQPYPVVGDFFVGEYCNLYMSRSDVFDIKAYVDGKEILPEKSSGVMVVVGASTGPGSWFHNIHMCYFGKPDELGREEEIARIIARENAARPVATLHKGQTLLLDSYNDTKGIIAPDSHEEHGVEFDIGSQAKIWISDLKLPVVRMD